MIWKYVIFYFTHNVKMQCWKITHQKRMAYPFLEYAHAHTYTHFFSSIACVNSYFFLSWQYNCKQQRTTQIVRISWKKTYVLWKWNATRKKLPLKHNDELMKKCATMYAITVWNWLMHFLYTKTLVLVYIGVIEMETNLGEMLNKTQMQSSGWDVMKWVRVLRFEWVFQMDLFWVCVHVRVCQHSFCNSLSLWFCCSVVVVGIVTAVRLLIFFCSRLFSVSVIKSPYAYLCVSIL